MMPSVPLSPRAKALTQKVTRRYLEDLSTTADNAISVNDITGASGILVRTSTEAFATRQLVGTANQVIITNSGGVSGNPTLALPQAIATTSDVTFNTMTNTALTASSVVVTDSNKTLSSSAVTSTELGYVSGVSSSIQTQLNNSYSFKATRGSTQSIGTGSYTKVQFATEVFDSGNLYDNSTNYRYTAAISGIYSFTASVRFAAFTNANVNVELAFYKNGSIHMFSGVVGNTALGSGGSASLTGLINLAAADYVEVFVLQSDAGSVNILGDNNVNFFCGHRVGA